MIVRLRCRKGFLSQELKNLLNEGKFTEKGKRLVKSMNIKKNSEVLARQSRRKIIWNYQCEEKKKPTPLPGHRRLEMKPKQNRKVFILQTQLSP